MAECLLLDSCGGHYLAPNMQMKWTQQRGASIAVGAGRDGGNAIRAGFTTSPIWTLPSNNGYSTLTTGVAFSMGDYSNNLISWNNAYAAGGGSIPGFGIGHIGDGRLLVNLGGVTKPIPDLVLSLNTYYVLRVATTMTLSVALVPTVTYRIYFNGGTVPVVTDSVTYTAPLTLNTAFTYISLTAGGPGGGNTTLFDDLWVTDGGYDDPTGDLGDVYIVPLFTNADGDVTGWTPLSVGANYLQTKEHDPDGDTSYIHSSVAGDEELENLDDIGAFSGTVKAMQALWCVKKSAAGLGQYQGEIKSGGTTVNTIDIYPSFGSYNYGRKAWRLNPVTGLEFTVAEINDLQIGALRTA